MTTYSATLTALKVKQEDRKIFKGTKDALACNIYLIILQMCNSTRLRLYSSKLYHSVKKSTKACFQ